MERSWADVFFHFVWATKGRVPLLDPELERAVYRCIQEEAQRLGCIVLAVGGTEDHVHLAVKAPTTVSPAKLMQLVKGVSSHMIRSTRPEWDGFDWQDNYAVFSLSRSHLDRVIEYVLHQKDHHAEGRIWDQWERTSETVMDSAPRP